eukprot:4325569-Prorocentrum_lima.AAC.1
MLATCACSVCPHLRPRASRPALRAKCRFHALIVLKKRARVPHVVPATSNELQPLMKACKLAPDVARKKHLSLIHISEPTRLDVI